ncbi:ElaB/YqjD/DUF883 family membrane-anchored ribosome-binding protein [Bradyrhizobium sp. USDA 4463]
MSHQQPPSRNNIIEFLVLRKFPPTTLVGLSNRSQPKGTTILDRMLRNEQITRYQSELQSLASDELQSLYEAEGAKALADLQREEEGRFFNQPHAAADFDHWSKAEHWSLDEAIALAMGKAPEVVSWEKIKAYGSVSRFVTQYARLRDLTQRAKAWQKLFDPVLPPIFIKWAEDNEIAIPAQLSEKVSRFRGKLIDWEKEYTELKSAAEGLHSSYDRLREMYDQHIADWKKVVQMRDDVIETQHKRIAEREEELAAIREAPAVGEPAKLPSSIERQNMLKAIYAMALKGYGYNPEDKRSKVISEIVSDISLAGFSVSDDTIRRYLKEARENADGWQERSSS